MIKRMSMLTLLSLITLFVTGCIQPIVDPAAVAEPVDAAAATSAEDRARVVRIGWSGAIDTLNPVATQSLASHVILYLTYDAMYQSELDGSYTPEVAETVDVSEDGKRWNFTIRDGLAFADGERLTADDVAFSYNLYMGEPNSMANSYTEYFASVEAVDERTVVVTLTEAIPNMESQLLRLYILPEHIWSGLGDRVMEYDNLEMVGSGPFTLSGYSTDELVALTSNKAHPTQAPRVDGVEFVYLQEDGGAVDAITSGDVDVLYVVTAEIEEALADVEEIEIVAGPPTDPLVEDIIFNLADETSCPEDGVCSGHPALKDRNVRLAMAHATDKQTMIDEVLNGWGSAGLTLIPDGLGVWFNDSLSDYEFDIEKANQILDDAGYDDSDGDGVREMPGGGEPLIFRAYWEGEAGEPMAVAEIASAGWEEIGIRLEGEGLDFDALLGACCPSFDFDIIFWGWGSDPDPSFLLSIMTSDAIPTGMSETAYANPQYDALFAEQAVTLDPDARREIVWRMQELVHEDIPYIIPFYAQSVQAYRTDTFDGWITDGGKLELADISSLSSVEPVE